MNSPKSFELFQIVKIFMVFTSFHHLKKSAPKEKNLIFKIIKLIKKLSVCKMPVDNKPVLRFAKLTEHAFAPLKGSEKAAGFDLKR